MKHFKLSVSDDIKAYGYDKNGKLISSYFDSNFSSLRSIHTALCNSYHRSSNNGIAQINVVCEDKGVSAWYKVYGVNDVHFKKI